MCVETRMAATEKAVSALSTDRAVSPAAISSPTTPITTLRTKGCTLRIRVALFAPWIGRVRVAISLPESEPILDGELDAAQPLGALPEVAPWHDRPQGVAVLGLQRLAVVLPGEQALRVEGD